MIPFRYSDGEDLGLRCVVCSRLTSRICGHLQICREDVRLSPVPPFPIVCPTVRFCVLSVWKQSISAT